MAMHQILSVSNCQNYAKAFLISSFTDFVICEQAMMPAGLLI